MLMIFVVAVAGLWYGQPFKKNTQRTLDLSSVLKRAQKKESFDPKTLSIQLEGEDLLSNPIMKEKEIDLNIDLKDQENKQKKNTAVPPTVITFYLTPKSGNVFLGTNLLRAFLETHLFYGDMKIYHYHENPNGHGEKLFSIASSIEPGTFEIGDMPAYTTPGICLFLVVNSTEPFVAFEIMLKTAKKLATILNADLKNSKQAILTLEKIENALTDIKQASDKITCGET